MPPKTTGRKLSPIAKAEEGNLRTCTECGESKIVNEKHFSLKKKGVRGWNTVCRVCQGVAASTVIRPVAQPVPDVIDSNEDLILTMYSFAENPTMAEQVYKIAGVLEQRVRDLGYTREGLELFIEIVKPLVAGWREPGRIHDDIKAGLISDHRRRLIIATRYSAKSTLTSIYVAWRIFLDPLLKVMIISRGSKLATRMLRVIRKVYIQNCPMLKHLMPTEDCLDNAEQFQTPQASQVATGGATLSSFGVTSDLPGYRADLTIGDDVEGPSDDTPEKVVDLEEKLNELHMINPTGEKIMLGTYQTEFSVYAKLADKVDVNNEPVWELHRACMFEEEGDLIHSRWVEMFTDKDALDWRRSVTARAWKLHAMLIADPSILNERPLKIQDFLLYNYNPRANSFPLSLERTGKQAADIPTWGAPKGDIWYWGDVSDARVEPYALTVAAIDPASGLAGRDAIGVAIVGVTVSGQAVVRHLEGVRGPTKAANMRRCAEILKAFSATVLVIEETKEGFFGETLENELIIIDYPLTVEKVTTGGQQKGRRIIESLAPPMGDGRIIMLEAVARSDYGGDFVNQMTRISYDGRTGKAKDHDDIVDALAHAVAKVKGSLISDRADNIAAAQETRYRSLIGVPLKYGGFGLERGNDNSTNTEYYGRPINEPNMGQSYGEIMLGEDEVLIAMLARRDRLMEVMREDQHLGRTVDPKILARIKTLNRSIEELKEAQVL